MFLKYLREPGAFQVRTIFAALGFLVVAILAYALYAVLQDPDSQRVLERAIAAHGGEKNLAKTLTGAIKAKANMHFHPPGEVESEGQVQWEETFQLPRCYKRTIEYE